MQRVLTCSSAPTFSIIVLLITAGINGITHDKKREAPPGSGLFDHKAPPTDFSLKQAIKGPATLPGSKRDVIYCIFLSSCHFQMHSTRIISCTVCVVKMTRSRD